jgi:hypothetical protein
MQSERFKLAWVSAGEGIRFAERLRLAPPEVSRQINSLSRHGFISCDLSSAGGGPAKFMLFNPSVATTAANPMPEYR